MNHLIKQPSPPNGPPPPTQLFVFKIATNLSTSASSYSHIIKPLITMATNEEELVSTFQEKSFVIYTSLKKMQNSWTMNIKQNVMSRTRITHYKFFTNKIQNGRQSAILIIFSHYLGNLA